MEAETQQPTNSTDLLPLDRPRVIALRDGNFTYTFHFRRITADDWMRYFDGILYTSRNLDKAEVTELDMDTAGIELFERTLIKAEGYRGDFMTKPDWQKKVPARHANAVAWALRGVGESSQASDLPIDPERVEIALDAIWSSPEVDGVRSTQATAYKGLLHFFAPPSAKDKQRFYRAGAQSKVVGGSRQGVTIHPKRHRVLIDLYDTLILGVEGYGITIAGTEDPKFRLRQLVDREQIIREMDANHKMVAAQALFNGITAAPQQQEEAQAA